MIESRDKDERVFLHDLASPMGAAFFLVDMVLSDLQSREGVQEGDLAQLRKLWEVMEKIKVMMEERRELLKSRSGKK